MAYEVVMSYHLHMPSYFLGTFTEYPFLYLDSIFKNKHKLVHNQAPVEKSKLI